MILHDTHIMVLMELVAPFCFGNRVLVDSIVDGRACCLFSVEGREEQKVYDYLWLLTTVVCGECTARICKFQ